MSTNPDNPSNKPHGDDHSQSPVPEKRTVRPPGVHDVRDPSSSPDTADQLTVLAHDLSNMLDGSMRWLSLAAAAMPEDQRDNATKDLVRAREQIGTVLTTLERMSSMVNAAMRSKSVPLGSPVLGVSEAVSIAMAIDHAVDVVRPMAGAVGASIKVRIDPRAGRLPAGPLYTVILNALFNAVQSIGSATSVDSLDPGGEIEVVARTDTKRDETVLEVIDDGIGLDRKVRNNQAFKHGVSTKDEHSGFGLAMAHQIVEQLEGIITLTQREDRESTARPGAILRVCIPQPDDEQLDLEIG
ncbi:MAG: HAMP domain-containing histidine kinase [Phycisphaerales bacterium]|nr:HAMP domain-containing histidine kinase [Phycisphaerales bacterium]